MKGVTGLTARVIQHEVDHLNAILFIDLLDADEKKKQQPAIDALIKKTRMASLK